jgi:hypothetical protein
MSADLVLYRRMRGMFWGGLVAVVIGLPALIFLGIGIFAAVSDLPEHNIHDLGGPTNFFEGGLSTLILLSSVVALLIGATAGSVDHQRGVLRDLVLTGRPRVVIALRRVAGAITWILIALAASIAVLTIIALALAPDTGGMDWSRWGRDVLAVLPQVLAALLMGAGFALIIGSRGTAVIVYFVIALFVDNILVAIPKVGDWWEHVSLNVAEQRGLHQIAPQMNAGTDGGNSTAIAWLVYVAWATIPLLAGLIRLERRDL